MPLAKASMSRAWQGLDVADTRAPELYLESLGVTEAEKGLAARLAATRTTPVDPVVSVLVGATSGHSYRHLVGRLREYPIPRMRLPPGEDKLLLDVGCSWGRWSLAASRAGYRVVGVDPSLGAVMAARRAAHAAGHRAVSFVVGDARFLPFEASSIDCVFSYSVLQHFQRSDAERSVSEFARVLRPHGRALVQMAHRLGVRSAYHQARRGFRAARAFEVRYWSLGQLERLFSTSIGPTSLSVDCYFGLGLQPSDAPLMPRHLRLIVALSEVLRRISIRIPLLLRVADSVYVEAHKVA